jgi:hypothetical protein
VTKSDTTKPTKKMDDDLPPSPRTTIDGRDPREEVDDVLATLDLESIEALVGDAEEAIDLVIDAVCHPHVFEDFAARAAQRTVGVLLGDPCVDAWVRDR